MTCNCHGIITVQAIKHCYDTKKGQKFYWIGPRSETSDVIGDLMESSMLIKFFKTTGAFFDARGRA